MHPPHSETDAPRHGTNRLASRSAPSPLDLRADLIGVLIAIAAIGSEPLGSLRGFVFYLPLVLVYAVISKCGIPVILRRVMPIVPVLALLALGLPLSRKLDVLLGAQAPASDPLAWAAALSLFLRALFAILLITALAQSTGFDRILVALRRIGMPLAVLFTLEHIERYRALIAEEWHRTNLAREARSPGGVQFAFASYANQMSLVLLRSWDRGERVHQAMLARGFRLDAPLPPVPGGGELSAMSLLRAAWLPALTLIIRLAV